MNYEEFEKNLLKIVYEDNIYEIRPSELAFSFDLTIENANRHLELAAQNGILDVNFSDGSAVYFVPGMQTEPSPPELSNQLAPQNKNDGADGNISNPHSTYTMGADGEVKSTSVVISRVQIPSNADSKPVIGSRVSTLQQQQQDIVVYEDDRQLVARIQRKAPREELMFSNASRTMFNRKILIENTEIEREELVTRVTNFFRTFGYRSLETRGETIRFERGSVAFLVALIPLFVLILPMMVYLFLSVLGRSTIQKEPILLDVKFETKGPYLEIDLTFLGQHGVVLGPADQKVLNREIDTLRDELEYAFHG